MKRVNLVAILSFILPINITFLFRLSQINTVAIQKFMSLFNNNKIILAVAKNIILKTTC